MHENYKVLLYCTAAGASFGRWQHDVFAGIFMFAVLIMASGAAIVFRNVFRQRS